MGLTAVKREASNVRSADEALPSFLSRFIFYVSQGQI